ncbi:MAG: hypothetical protein EXQ56_01285 [Acidobacteria bacterium]|nr:hypothetical protein [Acidobacteriota bacterium]
MSRPITATILLALLAMVAALPAQRSAAQNPTPLARDEQSPEVLTPETEKTTRLTVQVVEQESKKPIYNAHVVVRFEVDRRLRRDKRVSWESKANQKGVVVLSNIPRGTVKIQVIARGYQTYGEQHELKESAQEITIPMKLPSGQKSAY